MNEVVVPSFEYQGRRDNKNHLVAQVRPESEDAALSDELPGDMVMHNVSQPSTCSNSDSTRRSSSGLPDSSTSSFSIVDLRTHEYVTQPSKYCDQNSQLEFASILIHSEINGQIKEGLRILKRLADKYNSSAAQYLLGDALSCGIGPQPEDLGASLCMFLMAAKGHHIEAVYRVAVCYEYGLGTRRDYAKAVQFLRHAAIGGHPGAALRLGRAILKNELGLTSHDSSKEREGVKWYHRSCDNASFQYPAGPYELALLHETHKYSHILFSDATTTISLLTISAELDYPPAHHRLGECYEHGIYCPADPAKSIHHYTIAASDFSYSPSMLALCAWYMAGASDILEPNANEAYAWAKSAAEGSYPKAEYTVGYFCEMGIGVQKNVVEANLWYERAAAHGDERARHRQKTIKTMKQTTCSIM